LLRLRVIDILNETARRLRRSSPGTSDSFNRRLGATREEYERLQRISDEARMKSEQARLALEHHVAAMFWAIQALPVFLIYFMARRGPQHGQDRPLPHLFSQPVPDPGGKGVHGKGFGDHRHAGL
jgi:hypothetical protein